MKIIDMWRTIMGEEKQENQQTEDGRLPEMEITRLSEKQVELVTGGTGNGNPETELPEIFD